MMNKQSLIVDLENMHLKHSDTVLFHTSMKAIGPVDGGADTVLEALEEYFAKSGLLAFPTLTWRIGFDLTPEAGTSFSVKDSPTDVGILAELFRKRPGVLRSLHPTHSVAAEGPRAREFIAGHENAATSMDWNSPWGKLYDWNAKILFCGCHLASNTFLHAVEEKFGVPGLMNPIQKHLTVTDADGRVIPMTILRHTGSHSEFYGLTEAMFLEQGVCTIGKFGNARCYIVDARRAAESVWALLKKYPHFFTEEFHDTKVAKDGSCLL